MNWYFNFEAKFKQSYLFLILYLLTNFVLFNESKLFTET